PPGGTAALVELDTERVVLGRDPHCDVHLSDDSVSRKHAAIVPADGGYTVQDLASTNGTYVNDQRITSHVLAAGDRLRLGNQIFKFLAAADIESQYHEAVFQMITTDGLTQVYNKRYLLDVMRRELLGVRRHHQPLSLLMIDVDRF